MSSNAPNRIAELRKQKGLTQQALADAVGAHWITISKLERGKLPLSFEWAERLGKILGVGEFGVYKQDLGKQPIFVDGVITDGGVAYYYSDEDGKEDFDAYDVSLSLARKGNTNWFLIDNDGFFPFFQTDDLVQVEWVNTDEVEALCLNRLCLAGVTKKDEKRERLILGFLVRGKKTRQYDLNILSGPPLRDVDINGVAAVTMALFNPIVWDKRSKTSL